VNSLIADGKSAIELESTVITGEDVAVVKVIILAFIRLTFHRRQRIIQRIENNTSLIVSLVLLVPDGELERSQVMRKSIQAEENPSI